MKLYVGNLPYSVTESDLREAFGEFGEISDAVVISDRYTGQSKGFGFVEFPDDSAAKSAIDALNETDLKGRTIRVNEARPREERPPRRY